jgi:hypothetical protein
LAIVNSEETMDSEEQEVIHRFGSDDEECLQRIGDALYDASLALSFCSGLVATDRPDLPREEWPVFTLDFSKEATALVEELKRLHQLSRTGSYLEGGQCKTCPLRTPT